MLHSVAQFYDLILAFYSVYSISRAGIVDFQSFKIIQKPRLKFLFVYIMITLPIHCYSLPFSQKRERGGRPISTPNPVTVSKSVTPRLSPIHTIHPPTLTKALHRILIPRIPIHSIPIQDPNIKAGLVLNLHVPCSCKHIHGSCVGINW